MRLVGRWGMLSWGEEEPHLRTVGMVFRGNQDMTRGTEKDSCVGTGLEGRRFGVVRPPWGREARLDHSSWACKFLQEIHAGGGEQGRPSPPFSSEPLVGPQLGGTVAL